MLIEIAGGPQAGRISLGPREANALRNFRLDDFLLANRKMAEFREVVKQASDKRVDALGPESFKALWWLRDELAKLGLRASRHIAKAADLLGEETTHCSVVLHCLDEAVLVLDYQIRTEWTYHYGENTENISHYEFRWDTILKSFPSARFEIESALDLFALQHYTASVFHFMRAAEHGLRALALELSVVLPKGKPLTHTNWNEIITHCDKRVKEITAMSPAGDAKDNALSFYSGAVAQLHYLKNEFRNDVMHARTHFADEQAAKASRTTKDFLEILSGKLGERPRKRGFKNGKIDWGF